MDEARKKLRVCLVCVVAAAILLGLVYYFLDVRGEEKISEGTLVEAGEEGSSANVYQDWDRHDPAEESKG